MSFVGLYTGLSGIRAAQTGMDIASHNVANVATKGYTRQRVEQTAKPSYQSATGRIGTGVEVESIARLRDNFLDLRARAATGEHAEASVRANLLASVESLSGEPDQGLSVRLDRLWQAAESWANDPAEPAARRQVLSELESVTETMRATANAWDQLGTDAEDRRTTAVTSLNSTLERVADLNYKLVGADPDRVGPELLDQRDLLLDEVARLTGAEVSIDDTDGAVVTVDGQELVRGREFTELKVSDDGEIVTTDGQPIAVGGEIGGLQRFLTDDRDGLPAWRQQLDDFSRTFADAVNNVNEQGYTQPDGDPGQALLAFGGDGTASAASIQVTTRSLDALAAAGDPAAQPHDGDNARAFADLRSTPVPGGPAGDPKPASINTHLSDLIVGLAGEVRAMQTSADAAGSVASGAELARTAEHGVSIDEEMIGLVRYQRALEASSRVMTTIDQALDVLVNRTGIVGR